MLGIGVLGLGVIGRRYIEGFRASPGFQVIAGYDPGEIDIDVARAGSAQELIENPAVDCVYIATPPSTHEQLVDAVTRANKAVFCEKPLAPSLLSAKACLDAVTRTGVPAAVNFPFATAPAAIRLRELVETGALGEGLSAHLRVRFRTWPRGWQQGAGGWLAGPEQGGFTREVMSHMVFLALRLFGPGRWQEATVERGAQGTETRVKAVLQFSACRMIIDGAVEGEIEDFNRFEVTGSKGSAVMSEWFRLQHESGDIAPARADAGQIAELAKLMSTGTSRLATFREAADVVRIIEDILAV